jgi:hypothetical protein
MTKGAKHRKTDIGRAIIIIKMPIKMPAPATVGVKSSVGFTSKPNVKNIMICQSQVNPSKKVIKFFFMKKLFISNNYASNIDSKISIAVNEIGESENKKDECKEQNRVKSIISNIDFIDYKLSKMA